MWLINGAPTFAAGEEKTNVRLPAGFGWRYDPSDRWGLNHMIHNLLPNRDRVYITYTIDFIPDSSPAARACGRSRTLWMDVEAGKAYPVFDVQRGTGANGRFTYPDDAPDAYAGGLPRNQWVDPPRRRAGRRRPGTCIPAASTPTSSSRATGRTVQPVPLARRTTGSRPARCRGTWR